MPHAQLLRLSEQLSQKPTIILDDCLNILQSSNSLLAKLSYSISEIVSKPFLDFVQSEERFDLQLNFDSFDSHQNHLSLVCKNFDQTIRFDCKAINFNDNVNKTYWILTFKELYSTKKSKSDVYGVHHGEMVIEYDKNFIPDYVSPSLYEQLGFSAEELKDTQQIDLVYEKDFVLLKNYVFNQINTGSYCGNINHRIIRKSGKTLMVENNFKIHYAGDEVARIVCTFQTLDKKVDNIGSLERQCSTYKLIAENQHEFIVRLKADFTILYANKAYRKLVNDHDVVGKNLFEVLPQHIHQKTKNHFEELTSPKVNVAQHNTGVWIRWTDYPIFDDHGKLIEYIKIGIDITKEKNYEFALLKINRDLNLAYSQLKVYKKAIDSFSAVCITDLYGSISFVNKIFCDITKYESGELIGQNMKILSSDYHSVTFYKNLWETIGTGKIWAGTLRDKDKYGNLLWLEMTIIPFIGMNKKPYQYFAIVKNRTEEMESQMKLVGDLKSILANS